jgi:hypothetical protein
MSTNLSSIIVTKKYYFKCGEDNIPPALAEAITLLEDALSQVKISSVKKSREKSKNENLFSPVDLNNQIKAVLKEKGLSSYRISCKYENSNIEHCLEKANEVFEIFKDTDFDKNTFQTSYLNLINSFGSNSDIKLYGFNSAWTRLTKGFTSHEQEQKPSFINKEGKKYSFDSSLINEGEPNPFISYISEDFVGFREMDFIYESKSNQEKVGIEVQFGKYAFMVYNVCAKMKIFEKHNAIKYGIEIVPTKAMQKYMSTGVSFFEQFVWDLNERGAFTEDVQTVVLGVQPNAAGFQMLNDTTLQNVSIKANMLEIISNA